MSLFVKKRQVKECLSLSDSTLKKYRFNGEWIEGIHWVRLNSRCIRYNLDLLKDWLQNRGNPKAHMHAIEIYEKTLLSNQKQPKNKKS